MTADLSPPPPDWVPPDWVAPARPPQRWRTVVTVLALLASVIVAAGFWIRLDYYIIRPGDALTIDDRITIRGAKTYPPNGNIELLFVRERSRITLWEYIWAAADPDVDLVKSEFIAGDLNPEELRAQAVAAMAEAKANARLVSLERLGHAVTRRPGVRVLAVISGYPAADALVPDDVLYEISETRLDDPAALGEFMASRKPGDELTLHYRRAGESKTATVRAGRQLVDTDGDGTKEVRPVLGVFTFVDYDFPIDIEIETSDIGGPSAGLAMTLSILDELTPGELTGGIDVAVTGEIRADGSVGEVGSVGLKSVAAKQRGADLMLVPKCVNGGPAAVEACRVDISTARERVRGLPIRVVGTVDEALAVLAELGGASLPDPPKTAAR